MSDAQPENQSCCIWFKKRWPVLLISSALVGIIIGGLLECWSMPFIVALFDLLKGTVWPITIVFVVYLFRDTLRDFFANMLAILSDHEFVKHLMIRGISQRTPDAEPLATGLNTPQNNEAENATQAHLENNISPLLRRQMDAIRADLNTRLPNGPTQASIDILVQHLAWVQLLLLAERIYRSIFGSQIYLLRMINSGGYTKEQLLHIYDNAKVKFPQLYATYSFDQYLNYLLSYTLIATQDQENYTITDLGKEFLKWMTDTGVTDNKPF